MIVVRPLSPEDVDAVTEVTASAIATLRKTYRPNRLARANKGKIAGKLNRIVAEIDGRVVGTVQYYTHGSELRLIGLFVHADARRQGVARALVDKLADTARQLGLSRLTCHTVEETGNVPIFERFGFTVTRRESDDYSESDTHAELTDVEMVMRLN